MPCNHPLYAFDTGNLTPNGKAELFITKGECRLVDTSFAVKRFHREPRKYIFQDGHRYLYDPQMIPCGSCSGCRLEHAKEWKVRCCLEASAFQENSFITLTYSSRHLPGDSQLVKKDLQDFFKRLRYYVGPFRYFACGEYGEIGKRPHYHAILFGVSFDDCSFYTLVNHRPYFVSEKLSQAWDKGLAIVGNVDSGSIAYVTGYVEKKQLDPDWFSHKVKPFSLMSRRPGIGSDYYDLFKNGFGDSPFCYGDFGTAHRYKLPRFFLRKLETDFPDVFAQLKARRQARGDAAGDLAFCMSGGLTDDQRGFIQDKKDILTRRRIEKL